MFPLPAWSILSPLCSLRSLRLKIRVNSCQFVSKKSLPVPPFPCQFPSLQSFSFVERPLLTELLEMMRCLLQSPKNDFQAPSGAVSSAHGNPVPSSVIQVLTIDTFAVLGQRQTMPRKLRMENRGDHRGDLFKDGLGRKGDKGKVKLARQLRAETTISWRWIAGRLQMGHWRSAANAVRLRLK